METNKEEVVIKRRFLIPGQVLKNDTKDCVFIVQYIVQKMNEE